MVVEMSDMYCSAGSLARLFVRGVLTTPPAELLQFDPVGRVRLVLRGDVVPALAHLAGESERRSLVGSHFLVLSL